MKLTVVVQRYGGDIVGGAERLARGVAEGLARRHEVEVVTTCAHSYRTWANHYPEGTEVLNGVRVRRFRTLRERDVTSFNALSEALFATARTPQQELEWIDAQGPYAPALVDHLHTAARDRDLLLFFTYLYHPTVHGIHAAPERSVLVPTAHDEAPFWMETYRAVFTLPAGLVFNTVAEQQLVRRRFPELPQPQRVIGAGIEGLEMLEAASRQVADAVPETPTLLYAGRIEEGKGVGELLALLRRYRQDTGREIRLWLMGEQAMELPQEDWIVPLGLVSEQEKAERLARATLLAAPSALESFGIVLLEALAAGTPVLANAASAAYLEHCARSNGGLCYRNYPELRAALDLLLTDSRLRQTMATQGAAYVRNNYSWPAIIKAYDDFLTALQPQGR